MSQPMPPYGGQPMNAFHPGYDHPHFSPELLRYYEWTRQRRNIQRMGGAFLACVILHYLAQLLIGVGYDVLEELLVFMPQNQVYLKILEETISIVFYLVAILLPFSFYRRFCGNPREIDLEGAPDMPVLLSATGISLGVSIIGALASTMLLTLFAQVGLGPPQLSMPPAYDWFTLLMGFISVVVLPSVIEELIFRQALLGSLQPYGNWFAIFSSALLFGLYHGNMAQFPYSFILGICLAYFVLKTQSIYTGMFIHFVNNLLAWGSDLLSRTMSDEAFALLYLGEWGMRLLFGIAGLVFLASIRRVEWRMPSSKALVNGGAALKTFFLSPGMLVVIAIYAIQILLSFS